MVFFHIIIQVCRSQLCVNQSLAHDINYVKKYIYCLEHIGKLKEFSVRKQIPTQ